jgi:peptidoglycan/LPS O-acetylase OafA/YrhL
VVGLSTVQRGEQVAPASAHDLGAGPSPALSGTLTRMPWLDGLRALAVAAVLAFHSGATRATGGSVGVDVFFVLSGFLITLLLVREHQSSGRLHLGRFYARRALRLWPALVLVAIGILIYANAAKNPAGNANLDTTLPGALFYVSDFQAAAGHLPLFGLTEHTWSLSIEEHFYLLWPLLLGVLLARGVRLRTLLAVTAGLTLTSAALPPLLWSGSGSLDRVYYAPDTRAQSLLIGCLLGLIVGAGALPTDPRALRWIRVAGIAGGAGLIAYVIWGSWLDSWNYRGGLTLVALAAVAVIAATITAPAGPASRVLAFGPLVALGRISYGIYLWHWPVFVALNGAYLKMAWLPTLVIRITVTLALATASWWLVERRFLRLRHRFDPPGRVRSPVGAVPPV